MEIYMVIGYDINDDDKVNWGYYPDFERAEMAVTNNIADLHEGCYDYMIIEKIFPGIVADTCDWFYKWNDSTGRYEEIYDDEIPECFTHRCSFFM